MDEKTDWYDLNATVTLIEYKGTEVTIQSKPIGRRVKIDLKVLEKRDCNWIFKEGDSVYVIETLQGKRISDFDREALRDYAFDRWYTCSERWDTVSWSMFHDQD